MNAVIKSLARECAPFGVRVNCIAPGVIMSDMGEHMLKSQGEASVLSGIPLGRPDQPEDVGKAAGGKTHLGGGGDFGAVGG